MHFYADCIFNVRNLESTFAVIAYIPFEYYINSFIKANATNLENARTLDEIGCSDSRTFRRLLSKRVLIQCEDRKYYLDLKAYDNFIKDERKHFVIIGIFLILLLFLYFLWLVIKYF